MRMNAARLLGHVKALPARERSKFLKAVQALEKRSPAPRTKRAKRVDWPDIHARARRIFGNRVLPNLVLLERDEEPG
jgi:hypothetical protein